VWPRRVSSRGVVVARLAVLGLWAACEEIVWRRVVLGELLFIGTLPALAVSSATFAAAHRRRRALHLATGASFGAVYVATGVLLACIAAHWTYNALIAGVADRGRGG
jgi:membrane protease YdiL (CAAX protease family)